MSNKPTTYYKYHSINSNFFKLIANTALWFSSRRELNDLFEGRFNIADDFISEAIEEASDTFYQEMQSQLPLFYQIDSKRFFQILFTTLKDKKLIDDLFNSNFFYSETSVEWFVWEYEDEWRILSNTGGAKAFKKECLKTIYFGYKANKQEVNSVIDYCKQHGYNDVEFKRNFGRPFRNLKFKTT